jgi:hypothetical protein
MSQKPKVKKLKAKKAGKVEKIIKPIHPSIPEKVQIGVCRGLTSSTAKFALRILWKMKRANRPA